jgi:hypothetical protein
MKRCLLAILLASLVLVATAAPALAAGARPVIGGAPPGYSKADSQSGENYGFAVRNIPATGGPQR